MIWTYIGPPEQQPAPPEFEWAQVPSSHRYLSKRWQQSNYLQAMEGGIDSSHVSFLHSGDINRDPLPAAPRAPNTRADTNTTFDIHESPPAF